MLPATLHGVESFLRCISSFLLHIKNQWPCISLRGHQTSSILAAFESPLRLYIGVNSNFRSIFNRFGDIAGFVRPLQSQFFRTLLLLFRLKFGGVPVGVDPWCWNGVCIEKKLSVKWLSKNSNLCEHDTSTFQTDRQTDRRPAMVIRRSV